MKKKILALIFTMTVSASMLAGCGNSAETAGSDSVATDTIENAEVADNTETECEHEWVDATCEEAKHCSKCGETEGAALGHTLTEATFKEAAVCTVCGETEGEPKKSYFEEHGAEVADAPVECTVNALIYNDDNPEEIYQMTTDAVWEQIDCYSEPAEEEGYQFIHLELCMSSQYYYDTTQDISYYFIINGTTIYDWYTGRRFPTRDMSDDDAFDYGITLEIDGVGYDVSYTKDIQWEQGEWIFDDSGDATSSAKCYYTYTFKVPNGYDGLVFAAIPADEYVELDTETVYGIGTAEEGEENEEDVYYAFDEDAYVDGTKFFRINREGMVPEKTAE